MSHLNHNSLIFYLQFGQCDVSTKAPHLCIHQEILYILLAELVVHLS